MTPIEQLQQAYRRDFGTDLPMTSGARTTEQQARLYANRANNKYPVAAPGTSKHESANAIDSSQVDPQWMAKQGWTRPHENDPVHWEPKGGYQQVSDTKKSQKYVINIQGYPSVTFEGTEPPTQQDIDDAEAYLKEQFPEGWNKGDGEGAQSWKPKGDAKGPIGKALGFAKEQGNEFKQLTPLEKAGTVAAGAAGAHAVGKVGSAVVDAAKGFANGPKDFYQTTTPSGRPSATTVNPSKAGRFGEAIAPTILKNGRPAINSLGGLAGGVLLGGLNGAEAINAWKNDDYARAAGYGLGALGSAAAMAPHPLARVVGGAASILGPMAGEYFGK
jgi:hypothetical protein